MDTPEDVVFNRPSNGDNDGYTTRRCLQYLPKDNVVVDHVANRPSNGDNVDNVDHVTDNIVEEHRVDDHRVEVEEHRVDDHRVEVEEPSIDAEFLARQKTLDKGKGVLTKEDIVNSRKRKSAPRGNGISIRENDVPLPSDSESDESEKSFHYGHYSSETESYESERSFDYLSDIEDEVIKLRKRKIESKEHRDEGHEDAEPPGYDEMAPSLDHVGDTFGETVREHEHYMEALMHKLKGNGVGVSDPFVMVEKQDEKYPIYDDQTHWRLKKPKLGEKYVNSDQFREALHAPQTAGSKKRKKHGENIPGTQQSQVVGTLKEPAARSGRVGTSATRGGMKRRSLTQSRFAEPQTTEEPRRAASVEPQPRKGRPRAQPQPLPLRMKSQRILHKKLYVPVTGPGSTMENEIVLD